MNYPPGLTAFANFGAFAGHTASVLISSLWEGILLATAIGLLLRLVPRTTARLRFAVWTVAFVVLAALPLLNAALAGHPTPAESPSPAPHLQLDPRWSYLLAALWLAAVIGRLIHLAVQAIKLRSLWLSAIPTKSPGIPCLDSETWDVNRSPSMFFNLFPKFLRKSRKHAQLCTSTELDRPSVIGFFAPRILIPAWLFDQLTAAELEQIVLHELEHLRRRDDWVNLFQKIGLVLFPLNPALLWIDRRLAAERELACDDGVVSRTKAPRAYATCLTSLAERRLEHRRYNRLTVLALGAVGAIRRSEFSRRIESILGFGWRSTLNPAPARVLAALLIAGTIGGAFALSCAPQLVSFNGTTQTRNVGASTGTGSAIGPDRQLPSPRFENAVFRQAHPKEGNWPSPRPANLRLKPHRAARTSPIHVNITRPETAARPDHQWMVLASWQRSVSPPLLVTLPDGRTFLATYATGPNQAGWLLIQL